ncbi:MAG: phosphomannomutase/phosphoglucomutase, partial [Gammaproteobacteria bacterium]
MGSMNHPFPMHIFRAYDIRGKVSLLGAGIIDAIAHGLAQQYQAAGQTRVAIGYDARISSPAFADTIARIFEDYSLEVTIVGCCSSPMLYFTARQFDGNGIMVTASHNPKEDNGIKWIIDGEPPCPEMIQQVAQLAKSHCDSQLLGLAELPHQIIPEFCLQYQQGILEDIQLKRSFKVVLDGLHGSAGRCADLVLRKMGCEVTALRCEANGHFPDHAPDPSQDKHLETLRQTVMQQQA